MSVLQADISRKLRRRGVKIISHEKTGRILLFNIQESEAILKGIQRF
jgi:hypothetical protein